MTGMSVVEYAKHRGCSDSYVRRLRRESRLSLTPDGRINAEASDQILAATEDPSRGGARGAGSEPPLPPLSDANELSLRDAMRRERLAKARLAELELGEEAKELVRQVQVRRDVFTLARQALERMRVIPGKLASSLAAAADAATCEALLEEEIAKVCKDLQAASVEGQVELQHEARAIA